MKDGESVPYCLHAGNRDRQKGSPTKKSSNSISPVKHPQPPTAEMEDVEKVDCLIPVVVKKNPLCAVCLRKIQVRGHRKKGEQMVIILLECDM